MDCLAPLTSFERLQEYALRHASDCGLRVDYSAGSLFVLEPVSQRFWAKNQVRLLVESTGENTYALRLITRGPRAGELQALPSEFERLLAGYADEAATPAQTLPVTLYTQGY